LGIAKQCITERDVPPARWLTMLTVSCASFMGSGCCDSSDGTQDSTVMFVEESRKMVLR